MTSSNKIVNIFIVTSSGRLKMKQEKFLKLNNAIGGLGYLVNVHVEGTDISGKSIKVRLQEHIDSLKSLIEIKSSDTVCSCGKKVDCEDEIAFFVWSGECANCDHVRGDSHA